MLKIIFKPLRVVLILSLVTGLFYPLVVTLVGQVFMARQANGSLLKAKSGVVGSELLAQNFENPRYFWPRPSAASYATVASGASSNGATSQVLRDAVEARAKKILAAHPGVTRIQIPPELLLASGSGLDPHLSPEAVNFQLGRVSLARKFNESQSQSLRSAIVALTEGRQWALFGKERVNILKLNMALDEIADF